MIYTHHTTIFRQFSNLQIELNVIFGVPRTNKVHWFSIGLEMDIFINQGEYTGLTDEAGVRVVLIDQTRMPFPFHEGFSVPTGFSTSVGIKKVELQTCTNLCNVLVLHTSCKTKTQLRIWPGKPTENAMNPWEHKSMHVTCAKPEKTYISQVTSGLAFLLTGVLMIIASYFTILKMKHS